MAKQHFTTQEAQHIAERLGIDWNTTKFDVEQFRMGMDVELEHGKRDPETNVTNDDPLTTGKIALAHLHEFPDYYTRLSVMEREAEGKTNTPKKGKTIVLYRSKYGSTKQYAQWIADALHADILPVQEADEEMLKEYSLIVFGGFVRIGIIMCADFIIDHWEFLQKKKIVLFSVSGTKPDNPDIQDYLHVSLPLAIRPQVKFFPLWGRMDRLDAQDRWLMRFPRTKLWFQLRFAPTEERRRKYREMTEVFDHVEKEAIEPLVAYCKAH